jgi:sugar phosphate isomerase/epimerase
MKCIFIRYDLRICELSHFYNHYRIAPDEELLRTNKKRRMLSRYCNLLSRIGRTGINILPGALRIKPRELKESGYNNATYSSVLDLDFQGSPVACWQLLARGVTNWKMLQPKAQIINELN